MFAPVVDNACPASPPSQPLPQNFDEILIPADHVSRSPNDTYYVDPDTVLRCGRRGGI